jgi:hypothetical protein
MILLPTGLELTDLSPSWGLVTVVDKNRKIIRQYAITKAQLEDFRQGLTLRVHGVNVDEWDQCQVQVEGRPCLANQAVINPDGTMVVNYGIEQLETTVRVKRIRLQRNEWDVINGVVHVSSTALTIMGA